MDAHLLVQKLKELAQETGRTPIKSEMFAAGISDHAIRRAGGMNAIVKAAGLETYNGLSARILDEYVPKILVLDIETAPILAYVWGLFDQNIGLNQISKEWHVMSWAAKWVGDKQVFYHDQSGAKNPEDDRAIMKIIWSLLDEADIILTQNGIKFDNKKLNARFAHHGFPPPSSFRHIDTLRIAKKHFAFTSNKLEWMTSKFNKKYKKLEHARFPGFKLWAECLKGNPKAWAEMKKYNIHDVLALEELYINTLRKWDKTINYNVFSSSFNTRCSCGSQNLKSHPKPKFTNASKVLRYVCKDCGQEHFTKQNELSSAKLKTLTK